jgi:hypothetical protein
MAQSVMERQRKRREKMKSKNFSQVSVWVPTDRVVEIKAVAAQMIEEGSKDLEPSPRQLAFAQFLCDKKGLKLSQDTLASSKKLSEWLNENKKAKDRKEP